jgi:hypothetical protein
VHELVYIYNVENSWYAWHVQGGGMPKHILLALPKVSSWVHC